jgi:anti-sigma B factor antagonist
VSGELDLANAQSVENELEAAEATDAGQIILDLSGLDFIDSTGIRLIVMADERSAVNGRRLQLRRGPSHIQRVFEITGTADGLPFTD